MLSDEAIFLNMMCVDFCLSIGFLASTITCTMTLRKLSTIISHKKTKKIPLDSEFSSTNNDKDDEWQHFLEKML